MKLYKPSKKRKKTKWICFALSFLIFIGGVFAYIFCVVDPIIVDTTYYQIETQATSLVSDSIRDSLIASGFEYEDLIDINYNSEGKVTNIVANSINLNLLARDIAVYAQEYVDKIIDQGVSVALGTFTGLNFLYGKGAKVNFKLVPIGSIHVGFNSEFFSAGINQTLHKISIVVSTDMTIVMPLSSKKISFKTDMLFCENLIVGDVPNVYLSGDLI